MTQPERSESTRADARRDAAAREPRVVGDPRRNLLVGPAPKAILQRIVKGDPLGLRAIVSERLRFRAFLCDADRVHLRALARCARFAPDLTRALDVDAWLSEQVDVALAAIVAEDAAASSSDCAPASAFDDLSKPLRISARAARRACVRVNALPEADRRLFVACVLRAAPAPTAQAEQRVGQILEHVLELEGGRDV